MAFDNNTQRSSTNQQSNDSWKAAGFLNFFLPTPDGKQGKVGAIPLKTGKGADELIEWLGKDPANAAKLIASGQLTVTYQSATPVNKTKFVLPE